MQFFGNTYCQFSWNKFFGNIQLASWTYTKHIVSSWSACRLVLRSRPLAALTDCVAIHPQGRHAMEGSARGGNMNRSVVYACTTLAIVMLFFITIMSRQVLHEVPRPLTEKCKGELCRRFTSLYQGKRLST